MKNNFIALSLLLSLICLTSCDKDADVLTCGIDDASTLSQERALDALEQQIGQLNAEFDISGGDTETRAAAVKRYLPLTQASVMGAMVGHHQGGAQGAVWCAAAASAYAAVNGYVMPSLTSAGAVSGAQRQEADILGGLFFPSPQRPAADSVGYQYVRLVLDMHEANPTILALSERPLAEYVRLAAQLSANPKDDGGQYGDAEATAQADQCLPLLSEYFAVNSCRQLGRPIHLDDFARRYQIAVLLAFNYADVATILSDEALLHDYTSRFLRLLDRSAIDARQKGMARQAVIVGFASRKLWSSHILTD